MLPIQAKVIIKTLLRPLLRFCLKSSVKIQALSEAVKESLLEVAAEELKKDGHEVNTSRLSLMTGLQRTDIKRLQNPKTDESSASILSKLIGQWQYHNEFCKSAGKARPLSFEGNDSEFASLVRSVSTDVNPYTVLFELERTQQVERKGKELVLNSKIMELKGSERLQDALTLVSLDWSDTLAAAEENIQGLEEIPNLHLKTEFNNISADALPKIKEWLLDKGTTLHEEARAYLSKFDKDVNPRLYKKPGGVRVTLGSYSFAEISKKRELENE